MKDASKIMYTIGRVFNIIELVGFAILLIVGILYAAVPSLQNAYVEAAADPEVTTEVAKGLGIILTIVGAVLFIVSLAVCLIAGHARKVLNNNKTDNAPHIIMLIIGVFGDIFYLLGGIFGLIAEHENKSEAPQE